MTRSNKIQKKRNTRLNRFNNAQEAEDQAWGQPT